MKTIQFPIAIIIGFLIGYTLAGSCLRVPTLENVRKEAAQKAISQVRTSIQQKEKYYQQKIDTLNSHEIHLNSQLAEIKNRMIAATNKAQRLQTQLLATSTYPPTVLKPVRFPPISDEPDLKGQLINLLDAQIEKDSLCNEAIINLEGQVQNRDTVIQQQEIRHQEIKYTLEQSLHQQEWLATQNSAYHKQLKKQRFRNTLRTIGAVIVSASAAGLLLMH